MVGFLSYGAGITCGLPNPHYRQVLILTIGEKKMDNLNDDLKSFPSLTSEQLEILCRGLNCYWASLSSSINSSCSVDGVIFDCERLIKTLKLLKVLKELR